MYTYKRTEFSPYELYTVGYNDPNTGWEPESDHATKDEAARRVEILNGGGDPETARKLAEAEARIEELEKAVVAVNRWYDFAQANPHRNTEERIKMMDYALLQCKTAMEGP